MMCGHNNRRLRVLIIWRYDEQRARNQKKRKRLRKRQSLIPIPLTSRVISSRKGTWHFVSQQSTMHLHMNSIDYSRARWKPRSFERVVARRANPVLQNRLTLHIDSIFQFVNIIVFASLFLSHSHLFILSIWQIIIYLCVCFFALFICAHTQ